MAEKPIQRPVRKKKSRTGLIVGALIVALLGAAIASVALKGNDDRVSVELTEVTQRTITQTVVATGMLDPETQVKISPEVSGEIIFLGPKEGDFVQRGQVLVRINPESILAERQQAEASISGARARQASSRANLLRAEQELARVQQLYEKALATKQELENIQSQVEVAKAELEAAGFQVEQQRAAVRQVQESVNKTTIVSPIAGTVTNLNSKVGEKVVGAIQMSGTEIMTLADLSVIEAVVDVSETDVVQVSVGDQAEVEVDAIPNRKFKAIVSQIANSPKKSGVGTNEQLTNFEVRVRFIDPDGRLRPGMTATATIETAREANVLAVPIQAVTTRTKKEPEKSEEEKEAEEDNVRNLKLDREEKEEKPDPIVFVRDGEVVRARVVATGIRDDQYIQIVSGLKKGETVVSGNYRAVSEELEEGSKIKTTISTTSSTSTKEKK